MTTTPQTPKPKPRFYKRWWAKLRRKTDARTAPPAASRRYVNAIALLLAIAFFAGVTGSKVATDAQNRRSNQRSEFRNEQQAQTNARLSTALEQSRSALVTANAAAKSAQDTALQLKHAACFIFELPPRPGQDAATAATVAQIRQLAHCTPDPTDQQ